MHLNNHILNPIVQLAVFGKLIMLRSKNKAKGVERAKFYPWKALQNNKKGILILQTTYSVLIPIIITLQKEAS